jgi:transposase-like protein
MASVVTPPGPATVFLHRLTEKYEVSETDFLVDFGGYRTVLFESGSSGRVDYRDRNHIEKWIHTFKMRTGGFHMSRVGSRPGVAKWYQQFKRYYDQYRPNEAHEGNVPAEVLN